MKVLQFVRACTGRTIYNAGEIAGFPDDYAEILIEQGYAEPYAKGKAAAAGKDPAGGGATAARTEAKT